MLFEDTPSLSFFGLGALFVVAPLDGVAHGRHDRGRLSQQGRSARFRD